MNSGILRCWSNWKQYADNSPFITKKKRICISNVLHYIILLNVSD